MGILSVSNLQGAVPCKLIAFARVPPSVEVDKGSIKLPRVRFNQHPSRHPSRTFAFNIYPQVMQSIEKLGQFNGDTCNSRVKTRLLGTRLFVELNRFAAARAIASNSC